MERFRWTSSEYKLYRNGDWGEGMKGLVGRVMVLSCLTLGVLAFACHRIHADDYCNPWDGRLVSLQG